MISDGQRFKKTTLIMGAYIILSTLLAAVIQVQGECAEGCQEPTLFYNSIGCKPIYASPKDCCPKEFDCGAIEGRSTDQCYFEGKSYARREKVDDNLTYGNCRVGCSCVEQFSSQRTDFTCAILDCPEWLGNPLSPGCYRNYELNKCCSVGEGCPPFDKVAKCKVDGKTYKEGERFSPSNQKCTSCVCGKGFEEKFEAPFCSKDKCIVEISNSKDVRNFCAPFYYGQTDCCPFFEWVCPKDDDVIIPASQTSNNDRKCKFGKKTLNVGDKIQRSDGLDNVKEKVVCECKIPPYLTCVKVY